MNKKTAIAVLVSGGGTNLQALIDAEKNGILKSGEIRLVVSGNKDAYALKRAEAAGIATAVCERKSMTADQFEKAILDALHKANAELIVLAGFMNILSADFVKHYPNRIINVHPSLIPSFCGVGYYGLKVHEKALERGVKLTGATVHFVNEGMDEGPIIAQKAVCVEDGDTPQQLQRRVMEQAEWQLLPQAIDDIANDRLEVVDGHVRYKHN